MTRNNTSFVEFNSKYSLCNSNRAFVVFTVLFLVFALLPVFTLPVLADNKGGDEKFEFKVTIPADSLELLKKSSFVRGLH